MTRRYENYGVSEAVSEIIRDIVYDGFSEGWSTRYPDLLTIVRDELAEFNVRYVSDFEGRWERRRPEKEEISKDK